jgi:hypothetical protein
MGPISAEIEVDVSREEAFALLSDLSARPSFTDHFLSDFHLTRLDPVGIGAGARFRVNAPFRSPWEDTTIVERGSGGRTNRIPNHTVWELTSGSGSLTKVRFTHWTEPKFLDGALESLSWAAFWQQRRWSQALRRLRDELEGENGVVERIAVAGGNRYATGIP